jgi:hypothetical protein
MPPYSVFSGVEGWSAAKEARQKYCRPSNSSIPTAPDAGQFYRNADDRETLNVTMDILISVKTLRVSAERHSP